MKTQTDLCNRALNKAGAGSAGQTASAEDIAIAQDALGPMLLELEALGVCSVVTTSNVSAEEIPDELFQGLATLLALDISPEFGGPVAPDAARQNAMAVLRRITAARPTYETLATDYF